MYAAYQLNIKVILKRMTKTFQFIFLTVPPCFINGYVSYMNRDTFAQKVKYAQRRFFTDTLLSGVKFALEVTFPQRHLCTG